MPRALFSITWRNVVALLLCSITLGVRSASADIEARSVGDFREDLQGWEYYGGWEFPGAEGILERDESIQHEGKPSAKLIGDFAKGGSYVAMKKGMKIDAGEFRFWAKAPTAMGIAVRLQDSTDQTFQHKIELHGDDWQRISIRKEDFAKTEHFGGAEDGVWHAPMTEAAIMYCGFMMKSEKSDALWVANIEALAEKRVILPPKPMPESAVIPQDSIFGFSGHMMHNDLFYGDKFSHHWRLDYTLPWVVDGGFGWMREPLYQDYFTGDSPAAVRNRATVDHYFDMYDRTGVRVLLCPMFSKIDAPGFDPYFQWIGELVRKHRSIHAVEMHNEPNLAFFWNGTAEQYADACIAGTAIIRRQAPEAKIVVGAISHLWWGPGVEFLKTAMKRGILNCADGVSAHPYRRDSAPEGGSMREGPKDPEGFEKEVRDFWQMVQEHNVAKKTLDLYFTEFGYSSGKGFAGVDSVERQADYTSRLMLILFELRLRGIPLKGLFLYDLKCDGENAGEMESNFGLINYEASASKPGYDAYSRIAKTFGSTSDWQPVDCPRVFSKYPGYIKSFAWKRQSDGSIVISFWRMNQLQKADKDIAAKLAVALPAGFEVAAVHWHDLKQTNPETTAFTVKDGALQCSVVAGARASWLVISPRR